MLNDWEREVYDNPVGWVSQHIRRYVESDGTRGHRWSGMETLLLTTVGGKTGKLRRTALIYGRDGARYVVVGSNGGKPEHPKWYLNLLESPEVYVQVGPHKYVARARPADGDERPRLWEMMVSIFPEYERFRSRTSREIPVVPIEPGHHPSLGSCQRSPG